MIVYVESDQNLLLGSIQIRGFYNKQEYRLKTSIDKFYNTLLCALVFHIN